MSAGSPGERRPAERPLARAEQRPDVGRHEARDSRRRSSTPRLARACAQVVAVVEDVAAGACAAPACARRASPSTPATGGLALRIAPPQLGGVRERQPRPGRSRRAGRGPRSGRSRGRARPRAAQISGSTVGRVSGQPTDRGLRSRRAASTRRGRRRGNRPCLVQVARFRGACGRVAGPPPRRGRRPRAWSRRAAGPRPCRRGPPERTRRPAEVIRAEVGPSRLGEGLVGALKDALGADVDPGPGRHLAVHHQAAALQVPEVLPGGPVRHQVGVGDEHARRVARGCANTPTGLPHCTRRVSSSPRLLQGGRRCAGSSPSRARPSRCRRRRRGPAAAPPPRGRGCS